MGVAWTVKIKTLTQCYVNSGLTPQTRDHQSANVGSCCQSVFSSNTDILPMLFQWWASVFDAGPALLQHWVTVSCFSGQLSELGDLQGVYEWYWWGCSRLPPQAFWPYWPSGVAVWLTLVIVVSFVALCGLLLRQAEPEPVKTKPKWHSQRYSQTSKIRHPAKTGVLIPRRRHYFYILTNHLSWMREIDLCSPHYLPAKVVVLQKQWSGLYRNV